MSGSQATKNPGPRQAVYLEQKKVQQGFERLERRCAAAYRGLPRKSGHGGKYTWEGPRGAEEDAAAYWGLPRKSGHGGKYTWEGPRGAEEDDDVSAAIDKKDPNYIDDAQGEIDRQVAHRVVEVPKAPASTAPSSCS